MIRILGPEIFRSRADQSIVIELLDDVRGPSADARHRKDWREKIHVNSKRVIGRRRIEIDVGVQLLVGFHELFDLVRNLEPLGLAAGIAQIARHDA